MEEMSQAGGPQAETPEVSKPETAVGAEAKAESEAVSAAAIATGSAAKSTAATKSKAAAKSKAKPKKGSAAWKRRREQAINKVVRLVVQLLFFALAPGVFSSAYNGAKYICSQIGAMEAVEPTSFVLILVAALAYTVVAGRFFCGYACAFGTLGDVLFLLATPLRRLLRIPSLQRWPKLLSVLQFVKLVVLAGTCCLCFMGLWSLASPYDPWVAFGVITSWSGEEVSQSALIVLVVLMVVMALFERSFCRFLCPMGALFSLMPILPFSVFNRKREWCAKKCNCCQDSCPVDIHPDQGGFHAGECIACGRCACACPMKNVNLVFVEDPVAKDRRAKPLIKIKGSGAGWVIAKAVLLLAVCWLLGLVRFAPGPEALFGMPGVVFP